MKKSNFIDDYSIIQGRNESYLKFKYNFNIISRLKNIADINKEKIVIIDGDREISYKNFMKSVYSFGNYLLDQNNFSRKLPIVLMLNGSYFRYIALYGVLATGSYYLPIEPELSNIDRIAEIIKESESKVVVTNKEFYDTLKTKIEDDIEVIEIENICLEKISSRELFVNIKPEDPAYMIYTSGSTGKSKGVVVSHKSMVNLIISLYEDLELNYNDKGVSFTSFSFDSCGCDIYTYILNAIPLVCVKNRKEYIYDIEKINEFCIKNMVTVLFLPTVLAERFVLLNNECLRVLYFGGEKFCKNKLNKYNIYNSYGLTETGILNTVYKIKGDELEIPLGDPILNSGVAIIDSNNNVLPKGEVGEIAIWGNGIALGYKNDLKLTNEKFIKIPQIFNNRCCKTGDMGYISKENELYFKGRKDNQVKLNGYRIELGEIKFHLQRYPEMKISIPILLEENGFSFLINFYVSNDELNADLINEYLNRYLPFYMIPMYHIRLQHIPLTINGKVDSEKLKKIFHDEKEKMKIKCKDIVNSNNLKAIVGEIFVGILNISKADISTNSNFFEMGGDSLKALKLQLLLQDKLGVDLDFSSIYDDFNISNIIDVILKSKLC